MKILLLGGQGQVGWELRRALAPLGEIAAPGRETTAGFCGDLERPDDLRRTIRQVGPRVIVNAAAYTDVEKAEAESQRAERINADAPGILAEEAGRIGAWLVHYSTDFVFDGSGARPWREDDRPAPLSVYGASKWHGEEAIRAAGGRYLIFRTQWVYAARGRNFLRTILRLAAERDRLEIVADQHGAPTGAELVADVTAHAVRRAVAGGELWGTYHLAARGEATWHAYARFIVAEARAARLPVRVSDDAVIPVATERYPTAARRPRNSRLDVTRLEETFDLSMPDWRAGVRRVVTELAVAL